MQIRTLGGKLAVSGLGLGCMGMSEFYGARDDAESLRVLFPTTAPFVAVSRSRERASSRSRR